MANGERVLALAPSHAACDALTMSLHSQLLSLPPQIQQKYFGRRDVLIREAKRQRLTVPFVARFLPEEIYFTQPSEENTEAVNESWRKLIDGNNNPQNRESHLNIFKSELSKLSKDHYTSIKRAKKEASIFVTTIASISGDTYNENDFDLVCIDEAGFVSQGNSLLHILRAPRLILSGDHCQLPPISFNPKSAEEGYEVSAMEKLSKLYPRCVSFLSTQYRSHELISAWSSSYMYGGLLKSHPSVASITLEGLVEKNNAPALRDPLVFVDTKGMEYYEEVDEGSELMADADKSIVNQNEAFLVEILVQKYVSLGVTPKDIGIISPYWSQVSVLRSLIWKEESLQDIGIHTVDSFQGKEKEMILISFVRSNPFGEIGFLRETRRINVSVTRAKRCLVVVGDSHTLSRDPALKDFVDFCRRKNAIIDSSVVF
eukprot:TRINITY_DN4781_c0_g1_i2.p1 TRINITY_DN4781_c0_g1~~TRINITY_DN4781_c0_g1_i2.p1  ORF type:complete len:430 (-),score=136.82 TRINITY_DN4781_c0_g1_i2:120-1409(-)